MRKTRTTHSVTVGETECELQHEPVSGSELTARVGENLVVAYLVYDSGNDIEDLMGECMGKLLSFHRYSSDIAEGMRALGKTSDGDLDLDRVWNSHGEEAAKRYLAKVRKDYSFRDVRERLNDAGIISWEGALSMLSDEIDVVSNWDRVEYENEMEEVLYQMWAEPEFFPGDPDAQMLACYEHGGQHWSLSGQGPQDRWDTSNFAGVWVPDSNLREELDTVAPTAARAFVRGVGKSYQLVRVLWADDEPTLVKLELYDDASALWGKARRIAESQKAPTPRQIAWGRAQMAEIYCQQFLDTYNDIISGRVYGCVVETFDQSGVRIDEDACWGYVGDWAEEALKTEFFEPACEASMGVEHV
jgi:hypothetical protein